MKSLLTTKTKSPANQSKKYDTGNAVEPDQNFIDFFVGAQEKVEDSNQTSRLEIRNQIIEKLGSGLSSEIINYPYAQHDSGEGAIPLFEKLFGTPITIVTKKIPLEQTESLSPSTTKAPHSAIINVEIGTSIDNLFKNGSQDVMGGENSVLFKNKSGEDFYVSAGQIDKYEIPEEMDELTFYTKRADNINGTKNTRPQTFVNAVVNNKIYKPTAFVCHSGAKAGSGHYIAFIKCNNEKWYLYDDDTRSGPIQEQSVFDCAKTNSCLVKYSSDQAQLPKVQKCGTPNQENYCWLNALMAFGFSYTTINKERQKDHAKSKKSVQQSRVPLSEIEAPLLKKAKVTFDSRENKFIPNIQKQPPKPLLEKSYIAKKTTPRQDNVDIELPAKKLKPQTGLVVTEQKIQEAKDRISKWIDSDQKSFADQVRKDPIIANVQYVFKEQAKNPDPDGAYIGIGVQTVIAEIGGKYVLKIEDIFAPQKARFYNDKGDLDTDLAEELKGKYMTSVFVNGTKKTIDELMNEKNAKEVIAKMFHDGSRDIEFIVQDSDGNQQKIGCQRSENQCFVTNNCQAAKAKLGDKRGDICNPQKYGLEPFGGDKLFRQEMISNAR